MIAADIRAVWLAVYGEDLERGRPVVGNQRRVLCPFHSEDHASCDVSLDKNAFFCRSCGAAGGVLDVVIRAGCADSKEEAVDWLLAHRVRVQGLRVKC